MLEKNPLFNKLFSLHLPKNDYAVFGSGPLFAHGLIDKIGDIDIIARETAWEKAKKLGEVKTKNPDEASVEIFNGKIEIHNFWYPGNWDIDRLIDNSQEIEGVRFVDLRSVLKFKKILNRSKDKRHIEILENYFRRRL